MRDAAETAASKGGLDIHNAGKKRCFNQVDKMLTDEEGDSFESCKTDENK